MVVIDNRPQDRLALPFLPGLTAFSRVGDFRAMWTLWQRRRSYRAELKRLLTVGPHMIDDIGLSRGEARRELAKPFWRT